MRRKLIASVAALLALSAGVAYAATQLSSEVVTQVCVNDTNGLMRASSDCRGGEHLATIGGGGGSVQVTQKGTFTVAAGETAGEALPLTAVTVSGVCQLDPGYGILYAKARFDAAGGKTMDVFISPPISRGVVGGQSLSPPVPLAWDGPYGATMGGLTAIATSNDATATLTMGAQATNTPTPTCKYLWQAVEVPN